VLSTFGAPLVTSQNNVVVSSALVRSLELTTAANAPTGTLSAPEGTRFRVSDHAGNVANQFAAFAPGTIPAGSGAALLGLQTFRISTPLVPTGVCATTDCGPVAPTVQISAEATGPDGTFNNPFSSVFFYIVDGTGLTRMIAASQSPTAEQTGGIRRWTWTVNFSAAGFPVQVGAQIFAIGVDGQGDALRSRSLATINIIGGS
jgi:hypothetical protein